MSLLEQLSNRLKAIEKKIDTINKQPSLTSDVSIFAGFYKGKVIQVCTNSLLWTGAFQHVENEFVVLSNATAVGSSTGINIISTPQVFVEIPILKITSISVGVFTQANTVNSKVDPLPEIQGGVWHQGGNNNPLQRRSYRL